MKTGRYDMTREYRLIKEAIAKFDLDLDGITVLTEAASGHYVWTPIIAALAGATVVAFSRDSKYGTFRSVEQHTYQHAGALNIKERVQVTDQLTAGIISAANIITNTGFLRPLNSDKLKHAGKHTVIPLMWETWEYREGDLDLGYCYRHEIPVLGTNESDPRLGTMDYLGPVAKKLLFELQIEVYKSEILICGKGKFAQYIYKSINADGAHCTFAEPGDVIDKNILDRMDAIIIADHESDHEYIGIDGGSAIHVKELSPASKIIHISGLINKKELYSKGITLHPDVPIKKGCMSVTTGYVGPKPVIDLHTAGLKVGEIMYKSKTANHSFANVIEESLKHSICQDFDEELKNNLLA